MTAGIITGVLRWSLYNCMHASFFWHLYKIARPWTLIWKKVGANPHCSVCPNTRSSFPHELRSPKFIRISAWAWEWPPSLTGISVSKATQDRRRRHCGSNLGMQNMLHLAETMLTCLCYAKALPGAPEFSRGARSYTTTDCLSAARLHESIPLPLHTWLCICTQ